MADTQAQPLVQANILDKFAKMKLLHSNTSISALLESDLLSFYDMEQFIVMVKTNLTITIILRSSLINIFLYYVS